MYLFPNEIGIIGWLIATIVVLIAIGVFIKKSQTNTAFYPEVYFASEETIKHTKKPGISDSVYDDVGSLAIISDELHFIGEKDFRIKKSSIDSITRITTLQKHKSVVATSVFLFLLFFIVFFSVSIINGKFVPEFALMMGGIYTLTMVFMTLFILFATQWILVQYRENGQIRKAYFADGSKPNHFSAALYTIASGFSAVRPYLHGINGQTEYMYQEIDRILRKK